MYLLFIYFLNLFLKPNRLRSPSRGQHADDAECIHFDQSKSFLLCTPSLQPHRASQIKSGCWRHPFTLQRAARGSAWPIPLDTNKVCIFNYLVPMYIIYYLLMEIIYQQPIWHRVMCGPASCGTPTINSSLTRPSTIFIGTRPSASSPIGWTIPKKQSTSPPRDFQVHLVCDTQDNEDKNNYPFYWK
jgi:hypothetical protein